MINQRKVVAKEDEKIGRDLNILDRVMHRIKQTILTRDEAHKIISSELYYKALRADLADVLQYSKDWIKKHGDYAYSDENETNRQHLYGYEHSIKGFKEDIADQHSDIMSDSTLDLHTDT